MAAVWVGAAALVAAGWRGRRSPHRLMRGAALWTLKVRRAGAPSLAPPRGAPCRRERPGGSRRQPRPGSAAVGASPSLSLRASRWSGRRRRPPLRLVLRGSRRAEGPREQAGSGLLLSRQRLTATWQRCSCVSGAPVLVPYGFGFVLSFPECVFKDPYSFLFLLLLSCFEGTLNPC